MVSVSVVSHRQAVLVADLLSDLKACCSSNRIQVILTINVDEPIALDPNDFPFDVVIVKNREPKGFGANHNAASRHAAGEFFCVINPDIRLPEDPFPALLRLLEDKKIAAVSALVTGPDGRTEDHARDFPRAASIVKKALSGASTAAADGPVTAPDWIAGMFMLFRTAVFRSMGGFDERYFLYYEDVDLCARLRAAGCEIRVEPGVAVVHHARRASRRHPRYFLWHLQSLARFLFTRPRTLPPL